VIVMSDTEERTPEAEEPVIKVDKRKTRRQQREEEAAAESPATPTAADVEAPVAPEPAPSAPEVAPPEGPQAEAAAAEEPTAPESGEETPEVDPFEAVNVYNHLRFLVGMFVGQAWVHLGLQAPPGAGETRVDLAQARLSIDMVVFIKEKLGAQLDEAEHNELEVVLSNLRVNYLRRQAAEQS
jgi:hypothetical protein